MFDFNYLKPFAIIDGIKYEVYYFDRCASNSVTMYMRNDDYFWGTNAVVEATMINGVLQTSVDMILENLANG